MKLDIIQNIITKYDAKCMFYECNEDEDPIREGRFIIEFFRDEVSYWYVVTIENYNINNVIIELREHKYSKTICNWHINYLNENSPDLKKIIEHSFSFF